MKFNFLATAIFALSTVVGSAALAQRHDEPGSQHGVGQAHGVGVVTAIDASARQITLDHEAIDKFKMPAATHQFKLKSAQTLGKVKEGDKVAFEVQSSGGELTIARLSKRN